VDQPLGEEEALALAKERLGRTGLALCAEEVLRAMDKTLSGRFLPVPKDKKGVISLKSKNLFTEDGMEEYLEKVAAHVTGFGEALKSGEIEAKPLPYAPDKPSSSPCKFCDFRDVCRARAHVK
jgi:ATP-dependent helicase/DNAse subunit B